MTQQILKVLSNTATGHPLMDFSLPAALITATAHNFMAYSSNCLSRVPNTITSILHQYHLILNVCADIHILNKLNKEVLESWIQLFLRHSKLTGIQYAPLCNIVYLI